MFLAVLYFSNVCDLTFSGANVKLHLAAMVVLLMVGNSK
jgi:hypothetical protein